MKYSTCEMNPLMEEVRIKSQLVAAVRVSMGFHNTTCERNLRIMDLSGTEKNNVGVEISTGSCLVYWKRNLLYPLPHLTFYCLSMYVQIDWNGHFVPSVPIRQTMFIALSRTHLLQNIS